MADPSTERGTVRILLLGGIGSGKSTVGRMLAQRGAIVIDADRIGHAVLEPGGPAFAGVAARWPDVVVDGRIDRSRLAEIVFRDPDQLRELEAITHPAIAEAIQRQAEAAGERPVVVEVPLTKRLLDGEWLRVLVDAPEEARRRRVVERGSAPDDVARRMAAQPDRSEWLAAADVVMENDGDLADLERAVDRLWAELTAG